VDPAGFRSARRETRQSKSAAEAARERRPL
jgi:hypothetical protein